MSKPKNPSASVPVSDEATEMGAIVHDLRNVLSAVRGFATVVSEDMRPDDPSRPDVEQILKAVDQGTEVATRLGALRSRVAAEHPVAAVVDPDFERSTPWAVRQARRSATVLVVEDDDLVRTMAVRVLRRNGYATLDAATDTEAEDKAGAHRSPVDLLLADVGLPRAGGPELAARLRQRWPSLRVLFMSGLGRTALAEQGIALDAAFLEKPFAPATLVERIDALLAPGTS
ncbi:MAG TPA: response regulator [Polyangia bacterium]|nr:response regulator [Polyangia bacterium]